MIQWRAGTVDAMQDRMISKLIFSFCMFCVATTAQAVTLNTLAGASDCARAVAKAFLEANPKRKLACIRDTNSMRPVFDSDCIVVLEPKPFDALQRDDIVTFVADWAPTAVVHRLVSYTREGWVTKGDNLKKPDPTVLTRHVYSGSVAIAAIHIRTGHVELLL